MLNKKGIFTIGTLMCSIFGGLSLPTNTFADSPDNHWMVNTGFSDINLFTCVLDEYEEVNNVDENYLIDALGPNDALPAEGLAKITSLSCVNQGVTNTTGLGALPNLENLDLSNNSNLYTIDVTANIKLKTINVSDLPVSYFDFSNNPNLESIATDRSLTLKTIAYVEKREDTYLESDTSREYPYMFDLTGLKFDPLGGIVYYSTIDDIPSATTTSFGGYMHQILTRGGSMHYGIYLNGDADIETHSPIFVDNNCSEKNDGNYHCNNDIYAGETFDTEQTIDTVLSKIFNLSGYKLSKVEIVPTSANIKLTLDTNTAKKGVALPEAYFTINYYFDQVEESDIEVPNTSIKAPNTGAFTSDEKGIIVGISAAFISAIAIIFYASRYALNRERSKVRFGKE